LLAILFIVYELATSHTSKNVAAPPSSSAPTTGPPAADVTLSPCQYRFLTAVGTVTITNHTHAILNYIVTVAFHDGTKPFAHGVASALYLHPGSTVRVGVTGTWTGAPPTHLTCTIYRVRRYV
jgi:hypothetical protein